MSQRAQRLSAEGGLVSPRVRAQMVEGIRRRGVKDERVLAAMAAVPRHLFVEGIEPRAYEETALPLGSEQTISHPYTVARMIEILLDGRASLGRTLEIGTGCGYQAAVLGQLSTDVYSVERLAALFMKAQRNLARVPGLRIHLKHGDGREGLPVAAPFASIIVAAAVAGIAAPDALQKQLAVGGRLVYPALPTGKAEQYLYLVERKASGCTQPRLLEPARFVPLKEGVA
ncbi:MAG: protein-L-isoaspartate(D-aspartate) O-methyltransferase [Zoogloeaceae bacterium]|nr:protein-L-isoaspartate(D-aspartate) O-methyltransferase [Zoogloeaceae bacterium]